MTAVFVVLLLAGAGWAIYSVYLIVSDTANPPMRKCIGCKGDGIVWTPINGPGQEIPQLCAGCDGIGWLEVVR